jgi:hypothetical protein
MLLGSDSGSAKAKSYGSVSGSTILNFLQVVLLDPVPGLHMYKLAQQEEERNLFTDFGPHCRALSARLDNFFLALSSASTVTFKEKQYLAFHIDADPNSSLQTSVVDPDLDPYPDPGGRN